MMDNLYLTEHIFMDQNRKLHYEKNDTIQEVKNHNWHRLLRNMDGKKFIKIGLRN